MDKEELKISILSQFKDEDSGIRALMLKWDKSSRKMNFYNFMDYSRYSIKGLKLAIDISTGYDTKENVYFNINFIDFDDNELLKFYHMNEIDSPSLSMFDEKIYSEEIVLTSGWITFKLYRRTVSCDNYFYEYNYYDTPYTLIYDTHRGEFMDTKEKVESFLESIDKVRLDDNNWFMDLNCSDSNIRKNMDDLNACCSNQVILARIASIFTYIDRWDRYSPMYQIIKELNK